MINILIILLECICFWICLHISFREKIKFNIYCLMFFIFYVSIFSACTYKLISKQFVWVVYIFVFIWSYLYFKKSLLKTFINYIFQVVIFACIQAISIVILYKLFGSLPIDVLNIVVGFFTTIFCLITYLFCMRNKIDDRIISYNKLLLFSCVILLLFYIYLKIDLEIRRDFNVAFYFFVFSILIIGFYCIIKYHISKIDLMNKNNEIYLNNKYNDKYNELLEKMRIRQHDYNNQITTIQSMCVSATSLDELISMQKEYINILEYNRKYDSILTKCNDKILAGYIYSMCIKYEGKGFEINPQINVISEKMIISIVEMTELLGIILNNAYEHVISEENYKKIIDFSIYENKDSFILEVANPANYLSFSHIDDMFSYGYSTKGNDRGIGLYRVRKIVDKYKGEICATNRKVDETNWFVIKISIPL